MDWKPTRTISSTEWKNAVKPEPTEAVGHASVEFGAQRRPSTALGKTQTNFDDEAHIDFNPVIAEYSVIVKGKPGMIVKCLIQGTPLVWKIDTGAINTFITEDVYFSILLQERPVLERARKQFQTADGTIKHYWNNENDVFIW